MTPAAALVLAAEWLDGVHATATPAPWVVRSVKSNSGHRMVHRVEPNAAIASTSADAASIAAMRGVVEPLAVLLRAVAHVCGNGTTDLDPALAVAQAVLDATGGDAS